MYLEGECLQRVDDKSETPVIIVVANNRINMNAKSEMYGIILNSFEKATFTGVSIRLNRKVASAGCRENANAAKLRINHDSKIQSLTPAFCTHCWRLRWFKLF